MRHQAILKSSTWAIALIWLLGTAPGLAATEAPVTTDCVDCHGSNGLAAENLDAPVIAGMPAVHIEEAIYAYKDGARQCRYEPLMCETVKHTSDARIADLAEHYAGLPRDASGESFDDDLAAKGEQIHVRLCGTCHVPPDDPDVADKLGIPLHGQRGVYLRYAIQSYKDGRRENLLDAMGEKLAQVSGEDVEALVNYYASYE